MAKGKEPAGLRRYRLAKKRKARGSKPRTRTVRRKAAPMARRRYSRKKGRRKGKQSIALLPILPPVAVALGEFKKTGMSADTLTGCMYYMTGYNMNDKTFDFDRAKGFVTGEIVAIIGHKVANRTGINKHIRKLTGGYLSL